jgi:predicted nucleic acid-binding protein
VDRSHRAEAGRGRALITLDTSAVLGLLDTRDEHHDAATAVFELERSPIVSALALAEVAYMVMRRADERILIGFLDGFLDGSTLLDCGDVDLPRIRDLMTRYADLPLGFTDAAVITCAERNGGRVLTFDRRDFDVVGRDVPITVVP